METNRRTWVPCLLVAVVAAGAAAPLAAQDPSVSVLAPRAPQVQPSSSPFSVVPDPVTSATFRISPSAVMPTTANPAQPQRMPAGDPAPGPTAWVAAPPNSGAAGTPAVTYQPPAPSVPFNYGSTAPIGTTGTPYPAMTQAVAAPAWRWHGYGTVRPSETTQPVSPGVPIPPRPAAPNGSAVPPAPASGPEVGLSTDWRQPGVMPAIATPGDPVSQSLPAAEPAWRAAGRQVVLASPNPMTSAPAMAGLAAPAPAPGAITQVAAFAPAWRGKAVTLDAPRQAGTYISRAVSDETVSPAVAVCIAPPVPARSSGMAAQLPAVKAAVERTCTGRGLEVQLVPSGPASLVVRLKVRQAADAEYLANAIARLPELGPYHVLFEMQVAR